MAMMLDAGDDFQSVVVSRDAVEVVMRVFPAVFLLLAAMPAFAEEPAMTPEARLAAAGHLLPRAPDPVATYVTSVRTGNLLFLSGHVECGQPFTTGKVGGELTLEQGRQSAEKVGLCMLATIKAAVGELSKVKRFVRILGMVQSTEDFRDHPKVMNGFSDLMVVAFGEAGKGARSAVGMQSLPSNIAVEIEATVELHDGA
jgi:enamine deaminase RidA (YjgF/YER057c/UK114 family)